MALQSQSYYISQGQSENMPFWCRRQLERTSALLAQVRFKLDSEKADNATLRECLCHCENKILWLEQELLQEQHARNADINECRTLEEKIADLECELYEQMRNNGKLYMKIKRLTHQFQCDIDVVRAHNVALICDNESLRQQKDTIKEDNERLRDRHALKSWQIETGKSSPPISNVKSDLASYRELTQQNMELRNETPRTKDKLNKERKDNEYLSVRVRELEQKIAAMEEVHFAATSTRHRQGFQSQAWVSSPPSDSYLSPGPFRVSVDCDNISLKTKIKQCQDEKDFAEKRLAETESQLKKLTLINASLCQKEKDCKDRISELEKEYSDLESRYECVREQNEEKERRCKYLLQSTCNDPKHKELGITKSPTRINETERTSAAVEMGQRSMELLKADERIQRLQTDLNQCKFRAEQSKKKIDDMISAKASVDHRNRDLEMEIQELIKERDSWFSECRNLKDKIKTLNEEKEQIQTKCEELLQLNKDAIPSNEALQKKLKTILDENSNLQDRINTLEPRYAEHNVRKSLQSSETTETYGERGCIVELQRKLDQSMTSQKELQNKFETMANTKRLADQKKQHLEKKVEALENENGRISAEILSLKETNNGLNDELRKLQQVCQKVTHLEGREKSLTDLNHMLQQEVSEMKNEQEKMLSSYKRADGKCKLLEKNLVELQEEKNNVLLRLSKISSKKLTEGNSAIVDLSDDKRPTKLSEIFSELYDNEWTEAFDEQSNTSDRQEHAIIALLLQILLKTHTRCQEISKGYLDRLTMAACTLADPPGSQRLFTMGSDGDTPLDLNSTLRNIRQMSSDQIKKRIKEDLEFEWKQMLITVGKSTTSYINKCLELSWDMSVKDPPVVLMSLPEVGSVYDKDRYRFYTEGGTRVAYVVWPGMLLHDGGPTLAKGVVQGQK